MDKYFSFKGLSSRSEYWGVQLVSLGLVILLSIFGGLFIGMGAGILGTLIVVAAIVICIWLYIATVIRRCRDADINPWWTLSTLIPYIGWIPWIVIGVLPTVKRDDQT
jgi:uncharacterized membrane protein YhaH (DUF805 family)